MIYISIPRKVNLKKKHNTTLASRKTHTHTYYYKSLPLKKKYLPVESCCLCFIIDVCVCVGIYLFFVKRIINLYYTNMRWILEMFLLLNIFFFPNILIHVKTNIFCSSYTIIYNTQAPQHIYPYLKFIHLPPYESCRYFRI